MVEVPGDVTMLVAPLERVSIGVADSTEVSSLHK